MGLLALVAELCVSVLRQLKSKYNMTVTFTLYYYTTSRHENVKNHTFSS